MMHVPLHLYAEERNLTDVVQEVEENNTALAYFELGYEQSQKSLSEFRDLGLSRIRVEDWRVETVDPDSITIRLTFSRPKSVSYFRNYKDSLTF